MLFEALYIDEKCKAKDSVQEVIKSPLAANVSTVLYFRRRTQQRSHSGMEFHLEPRSRACHHSSHAPLTEKPHFQNTSMFPLKSTSETSSVHVRPSTYQWRLQFHGLGKCQDTWLCALVPFRGKYKNRKTTFTSCQAKPLIYNTPDFGKASGLSLCLLSFSMPPCPFSARRAITREP